MIQQDQKSSPEISIGLPVYNGQQFIKKKLDSILAQSYPFFELIISDNASTDLTPKICDEYAKKDKRIRYIKQKKDNRKFLRSALYLHYENNRSNKIHSNVK